MFNLTLKADTWMRTVPISELPCTVGSSPVAGVSLSHVGWADIEGVIEPDADGLCFRTTKRPLTPIPIIWGQSFFVGDVEITAARGAHAAFAFGHYDEAPAAASSIAESTFQLADDPGVGTSQPSNPREAHTTPTNRHPTTSQALPRADDAKRISHAQRPHPQTKAAATPATQHATNRRATDVNDKRTASRATATTTVAERHQAGPKDIDQRFGTREFQRELVEQLKKSPFFIASALAHAALFFALALFMEQEADVPTSALGTVKGAMDVADELEGGNEPDPLEVFEEPIHHEPEDLLESLDVIEPASSAPPPPDPREELPLPEEDMIDPPPAQVGLHPNTATLFRPTKRLRRKKPQVTTPPNVAAGKLNQAFSTGRALDVNRASAKLVLDAIGGSKTGAGAALDRLRREDVLVVEGGFDSIERVLDALRIPYTFSSPYNLVGRNAVSLKDYKVVFWNCGEALLPHNRRRILSKVERFVRDGGYLFTTDWGIATVVTRTFPGFLRTRGDRNELAEMVVDIEPARGRKNHPLLNGVFLPKTQGKWWLERKSYDVRPGNKSKVEVLIEAPELREIHGTSSVVAATFPYGRGRVLHAIGHYYQKKGNLAGTIASHRLALNFVLMRMARHK